MTQILIRKKFSVSFPYLSLFFVFALLLSKDTELLPPQPTSPPRLIMHSYPDEIITYPTLMLSPKAMRCSSLEFDIRCPPPRSVTVKEGAQFFVHDYWPTLSDSNEIVNYHIEKTFWDKVERNAWEPITFFFKVLKSVLLSNGGVKGGAEYKKISRRLRGLPRFRTQAFLDPKTLDKYKKLIPCCKQYRSMYQKYFCTVFLSGP